MDDSRVCWDDMYVSKLCNQRNALNPSTLNLILSDQHVPRIVLLSIQHTGYLTNKVIKMPTDSLRDVQGAVR